jgi:hypothetical protein
MATKKNSSAPRRSRRPVTRRSRLGEIDGIWPRKEEAPEDESRAHQEDRRRPAARSTAARFYDEDDDDLSDEDLPEEVLIGEDVDYH